MTKDMWKQFIPIMILCGLGLAWAAYENPNAFFGLSARSDCEDYNTAEVNYRVQFLNRCGCLYPAQANALANAEVRSAALACFEEAMKQCRGWEKLGDVYQNCVVQVTGIKEE